MSRPPSTNQPRELDDRGNARPTGQTADGRPILVVVAGDDPDFVITTFSGANDESRLHSRAVVALANRKPVEVQLLYPDMGISEPLAAVADRYDLHREALHAAAQSALGAPDRVVVLEVAARAPA